MSNSAIAVLVTDPFIPHASKRVRTIPCGETISAFVERQSGFARVPFVVFYNGQVKLRDEWVQRIESNSIILLYRLHGSDVEDAIIHFIDPFGEEIRDFVDDLVEDILRELINYEEPEGVVASPAIRGAATYSLDSQGNAARINGTIPTTYGRFRIFPDFAAIPYRKYVDGEEYLFQFFVIGQGEYDISNVKIGDTNLSDLPPEDILVKIIEPGGDIDDVNIDGVSPMPQTNDFAFKLRTYVNPDVDDQELENNVDWIGPFVSEPKFLDSTNTSRRLITLSAPRGLTAISRTEHGAWYTRISGDVVISERAIDVVTDEPLSDWVETIDSRLQYTPPMIDSLIYRGPGGDAERIRLTTGFFTNPLVGVPPQTSIIMNVTYFEPPKPFKTDLIINEIGNYSNLNVPYRLQYRIRRRYERYGTNDWQETIDWSRMATQELPETPKTYEGLTTMLVVMRTGKTLSNLAQRKVSVLAQRKLPIYNAQTKKWSAPTATRNPVWAIADIFRSEYGLKLKDRQLDLVNFAETADTYESRKDYFDATFDRQLTAYDALKRVARCGRANVIGHSGIYRIVRDQSIPIASGMFTPANIVKNSFTITYKTAYEDDYDGVRVEYFDFNKNYLPEFIVESVVSDPPTNPQQVKFFGCTDRAMAEREASFLAKQMHFRRKGIRFTTEQDGNIPSFGDVIVVSHDMPSWAQSGVVTGVRTEDVGDKKAVILQLSENLLYGESGHLAHRMLFRGIDGVPVLKGTTPPTFWQVFNHLNADTSVAPADDDLLPANEIRFVLVDADAVNYEITNEKFVLISDNADKSVAPDLEIYFGSNRTATEYIFYAELLEGKPTYQYQAVVKGIKPKGKGRFEINAIVEDERVHEGT